MSTGTPYLQKNLNLLKLEHLGSFSKAFCENDPLTINFHVMDSDNDDILEPDLMEEASPDFASDEEADLL